MPSGSVRYDMDPGAGGGAGRADHDPALGPAADGGHVRGVFGQLETQPVDEEVDGPVVVVDDHGGVFQMHADQPRADGRGRAFLW